GDAYGDGSWDGSCNGSGYGDAYGYCFWDGSGDGYGEPVGEVGDDTVQAIITPWGRYARVGCQVHALDVWRERGEPRAEQHGGTVAREEAEALIAAVEGAPMPDMWTVPGRNGADYRM